MKKVGIIGASGYAGGELIRYLLGHPEVSITCLASDTYKGKHIGAAYSSLLGYDLPLCETYDELTADRADLFFLAQHNGWAMNIAPRLVQAGARVVDISADFRFRDASVYEEWYKTPHTAKDLSAEVVYGLPELKDKGAIRRASLVANPGCYPTSVLLALAPAVEAGVIDTSMIIVDSKSGVSGAGRTKFELNFLFSEINESMKPYGVAGHRHTPEIEQELSEITGTNVQISFTPHLAPMVRGILTTAYAPLLKDVETSDLLDHYEKRYADSPFVTVLEEGQYPSTKNVSASNNAHISLKVDKRTKRLVAMSVIDNMGKGAAGQAVQNMNLMLGFDEAAGLISPAVYP